MWRRVKSGVPMAATRGASEFSGSLIGKNE